MIVIILVSSIIALTTANEQELVINKEFLNGYNKFTGDVYNQLRQSHPNNFLVSPISTDILLALLDNGAQGETSKQIIKGLSLPDDKNKVNEAFSSLTPKLNFNDKYTLTSANKVYVKEGHKLLEDFKKTAETVFSAEVQNIDFKNNEAAANEMNKWVEDKTNKLIKDLINKDLLNEDTRVVLLNALYFHGNWVTKFNKENTKKEVFHNQNKVEVELMDIKHDYKYFESDELNAKFLELPYHGKDVTLTIVLPNERNGLTSLEGNIHKVLATPTYSRERVHVRIPKFKIETEIEFNDILRELGIVNAFEDNAEFPKINGEPLKISNVVQKALIEVEEEGTTAAAGTAVVVSLVRSGHVQREAKEFIANHPFIFILKYQSVVLFIGHFTGQ